jgi:hypothetical protein
MYRIIYYHTGFPVMTVDNEWLFLEQLCKYAIFHLLRGNQTADIYISLQTARLNIFLAHFLASRVKLITLK